MWQAQARTSSTASATVHLWQLPRTCWIRLAAKAWFWTIAFQLGECLDTDDGVTSVLLPLKARTHSNKSVMAADRESRYTETVVYQGAEAGKRKRHATGKRTHA